ncbi:hypothetical protein NPA08_02210 [Mycoplasmopsis citelli]|uniref:hypothetical protein n=1 Tax=Mycoplasmopsis citelli TaxID=171281 RepID=UPI0021153114|nr:hypothetical protein [Mycoplasmopsis citelli]UUD36618.1 hypothetical protein NPA08_02210 [Mycoplasmopsis citelli]
MNKRKLTLTLSTALPITFVLGVALGAIPTGVVLQKQNNALKAQNNSLLVQIKQLREQNKLDQDNQKSLNAQNQRLQIMIKDLQETNLSTKDFSASLDALANELNSGKNTEEIIKNVGYKQLKTPLLSFKNSLEEKINMLSDSLNDQLQNNNVLKQDTKNIIKDSINKGKNLLKSINENTFSDIESTKESLEKIIKSQNIFLIQITNALELMSSQLNKNLEQVKENTQNIKTRNKQIRSLIEQGNSTLNFYLEKIVELKNALITFKNSNFDNLQNLPSIKSIKDSIAQVSSFFDIKQVIISELLKTSQNKLASINLENDFESPLLTYNLENVNQIFEQILSKYEQIRNNIIKLYNDENTKQSNELFTQNQLVKNLQSQKQQTDEQIATLSQSKSELEANIAAIKNDLMTNLGTMLDNQISSLSGIEDTIRSSSVNEAESLANRLKTQINALMDLKNKYTAENYKQTFAPTVQQALSSAQEVIEEYKKNILDPLKAEYQKTLANLNSTKEQLSSTQFQLNVKHQELATIQSNLTSIQSELSQSKNFLETTKASLKSAQAELKQINSEVSNNKNQVKSAYDAIKSVLDNLKTKARTFLAEVDQNLDVSLLNNALREEVPAFNSKNSLGQMQLSVKKVIELSEKLNNAFVLAVEQNYVLKAQNQQQNINSLQKSKDQLENNIKTLNQTKYLFTNNLSTDVASVSREYQLRKTAAIKIKDSAQAKGLNVANMNTLLSLNELSNPGSNFEKQIDFVKKYSQRIADLSNESVKLQNLIIDKSKTELNFSSENLKQKNRKIEQLKQQIKNDVSKDLIKSLEKQKDQYLKQYQEEAQKLKDLTTKYTKFKNIILNSNIYKNARKKVSDSEGEHFGSNTPATGYTDFVNDKEEYGKYFNQFNSGEVPQQVFVINKINVLPVNKYGFEFKFKIYYIDDKEQDEFEKVKEKEITISADDFKFKKERVFRLSNRVNEVEGGSKVYEELVVIKRIDNGKFEFTNVLGTSFRSHSQGSDTFDPYSSKAFYNIPVYAQTPMINVQEVK